MPKKYIFFIIFRRHFTTEELLSCRDYYMEDKAADSINITLFLFERDRDTYVGEVTEDENIVDVDSVNLLAKCLQIELATNHTR